MPIEDNVKCIGCGLEWLPMYSNNYGYRERVCRDHNDNLYIECPHCGEMILVEE